MACMSGEAITGLTKVVLGTDYHSHLTDRGAYRRAYERVYQKPRRVAAMAWMKPFAPKAQSQILELGPGNGGNLLHYARLGHTMHGVEVSDTAIGIIQDHLAMEPEEVRARVTVEQGFAEDYRPAKTFDYVICCEVLEHVIDPVAVLGAMCRALNPEGVGYVTGPTGRKLYDWGHVRVVTPKILEGWTQAAGLKIDACKEDERRTYCWVSRL